MCTCVAVVTSLSPRSILALALRTVQLQFMIGLYSFNFAFILIGSLKQSCNNKI